MIVGGLQGKGGFSAIHRPAVVSQFSHGTHLATELGKEPSSDKGFFEFGQKF